MEPSIIYDDGVFKLWYSGETTSGMPPRATGFTGQNTRTPGALVPPEENKRPYDVQRRPFVMNTKPRTICFRSREKTRAPFRIT